MTWAESSDQLSYQCCKTAEFSKAFRKLDNNVQEVIENVIQDVLLRQPYESKRLVSPQLKGKRTLRKGDYRILFAICEECRKQHEERINNCRDCGRYEANSIMVFLCGSRKHIYDI